MDIFDYMRQNAIVTSYRVDRDAPQPYYTWGSFQAQYSPPGPPIVTFEAKMIIRENQSEVMEKLRDCASGKVPRFSAPAAFGASEPSGNELLLKASQAALKKLGEEKRQLEAKVEDLETRLTGLLGVLR